MADCSHPQALTRVVCQRCDDDLQRQLELALLQRHEHVKALNILEAKLQQAQEERDKFEDAYTSSALREVRFERERDAAIERAEAAEARSSHNYSGVKAAKVQLKQAKRDATEQRALAERRLRVGLTLMSILQTVLKGSGAKYIVREMAWLTPAEAREETL